MEWTLERINGPKNFIVLKRSERSYSCGRGPHNLIVCPSLVVSRRHCLFVRADDVISVIDLVSSNGVYVNGELLEPNVMVELKENDVVGIGSSEEYRDNEPMFVYKLHKGNLESRNLEKFDDLLTQKSSGSSTDGRRDPQPSGMLKRNLQQRKDPPHVPPKIFKPSNGLEIIGEKDAKAAGSPEVAEPPEAEEIQEVWSTLSPLTTGRTVPISEKRDGTGLGPNRMTLNVEQDKESKKLSRKVVLRDGEMELLGSKGGSNAIKEEEKVGYASTKQQKDNAQAPKESASLTVLKAAPESSHKTIHFSIDSSTSNTRLTVDILETKLKNAGLAGSAKELRDDPKKCDKEKQKSGISEAEAKKKTILEAEEKKKTATRETEKKRAVIQEAGKNRALLQEVEKTKKKAEVVTRICDKTNSGPVDKKVEVEPNRLSFLKDPVATSSPFKLKQVKQEPMTSFSLFDTVDLSDADDDDVFPSSQLFDSTAEDKPALKDEDGGFLSPKEEGIFGYDNGNMFTELDAPVEESEDIIVLSDSDDEDNPWLHRLSESQRIKEEASEVAEMPASPKMEFVDEIIEPGLSPTPQVREAKPPRDLPINMSPKVSPTSTKPKPMTVAEIEKDVNTSELEDSDDELNSIFRLPREKKRLENEAGSKKGPKLIEPLRLPQKTRLSLKDFLSDPEAAALPTTSTSKNNIRVRSCSVAVPKLPSNLTAKQKRELELQDRIKQKMYEIEQKRRRILNKWVQGVQLPVGKRKSLPLSKTQKSEIKNERKEKLKALANKQKESAVKPPVERVAAKPKAKVSTKNRGDFLISEALKLDKARADHDPRPSTSRDEGTSSKSSKSKSKSSEDKKRPSNSPKKSSSREKKGKSHESKDKSSTFKQHRREKSAEKITEELSKSLESVVIAAPKESRSLPVQNENREPNSLDQNEKRGRDKEGRKKKKKVSFSVNLVEVREYEITPNNTMRKCVGKDALIPKDKIPRARRDDGVQYPKLEEFLMDIFAWNPSWLEEQKFVKTEPPVVNNDLLKPLLTNYKSYKDYFHTLKPVLLLELWHSLSKAYEGIEKDDRRRAMVCSIVNNSVTFQPIRSTDMSLTNMMLEVLATEDDIRRQRHPRYGDLIFLELRYKNEEGKLTVLKVFAHVTQMHPTPITSHTIFNRDLCSCTPKASTVLTYTVLTRPLKMNLCVNGVYRLRCVMYLRAAMRMVQALQSLPMSPLMELILNPKVEQYQLSQPIKHQQFHLVTGDKLNHRQVEAVLKITEAVVRKEPKICLVQGPPGTGKSEVIVNMVMQILYGDNRYKNKESSGFRILLCAPSNAAIDEIVLRLLDRRGKLPNDRFKMVRVGLAGSMHPTVKDISIEELAKRDVKRTIVQSRGQSMNSVEEEKRMLEATINKLELELRSLHQKDEKKMQFKKIKLSGVRAKYDMINNCAQSTSSSIDPREMTKLHRAAERQILLGADIIACTLSSCYTNLMEAAFGNTMSKISVCIVDEATQSCEAETLIPLMLGVNTLILVGDPAQLPATVISQRAKNLGLDQSLFSRTQRAFEGRSNSPVLMLDIQYRMNSDISSWPNKYFYAGKLRNGLIRTEPLLPFHPYRVMNLDSHQDPDKFSNTQEAEFVVNLILGMVNHLEVKRFAQTVSFGIITPYRDQQAVVQAKIDQRVLPVLKTLKDRINVAVNTVDSFQGHEKDVIIMSCVRTSGIGFLADRQRLCVALTRAKHCLLLCGNFETFQRDSMWRALLADAQSRKHYTDVKPDTRVCDIVSHIVA